VYVIASMATGDSPTDWWRHFRRDTQRNARAPTAL